MKFKLLCLVKKILKDFLMLKILYLISPDKLIQLGIWMESRGHNVWFVRMNLNLKNLFIGLVTSVDSFAVKNVYIKHKILQIQLNICPWSSRNDKYKPKFKYIAVKSKRLKSAIKIKFKLPKFSRNIFS